LVFINFSLFIVLLFGQGLEGFHHKMSSLFSWKKCFNRLFGKLRRFVGLLINELLVNRRCTILLDIRRGSYSFLLINRSFLNLFRDYLWLRLLLYRNWVWFILKIRHIKIVKATSSSICLESSKHASLGKTSLHFTFFLLFNRLPTLLLAVFRAAPVSYALFVMTAAIRRSR
jgi:hypothetical protein